ncbi:hypothetical protein Pyn_26737 [Prunus yedoensis var. nudiflora]|uniref:Disease resistance protein winged helix domain-containing protein n=1 Tax=Prunus yedoensis var. nudiflora TaxID=2094558 RepID=A0A314UZH8_PRUYE|nr:hypothetical protein Pyn_26737 [Prunus yedoensis var. nudiflora]
MKAFSSYPNKSCSTEILPLARELVEKCEGLPLAIVAFSGLMSSKKSLTEWSTVYNSLNWHLTNNPLLEPMKSILLFSFNDLPFRLKQCFLYCSLFPEDHVIVNHRIIKLWIAEGFVEHVKGLTPEKVANSYLMELIFRNMLQQRFRGHLPACKMHDILREIALSIVKKENFCVVHDGSGTVEEIGALRLSIQTTNGEIGSRTADGEEFLRVDALSSPPPYLDSLKLVGKLEKGIEHLTKLQGYRFDNVSNKFRESIKEGGVNHARMLLVDERCKKYTNKSIPIEDFAFTWLKA